MGRQGSGVEVRERSIRFTFIEGKPTLHINGTPALPTPANVKWAHRLAAEMREKLKAGTFSLLEYFPQGGTAGESVTVGGHLETWLAAQRIKTSTKVGYETAIRFWKAEIGDKTLRSLKHSDILTALANHPELSGKTVNNRTSVLNGALKLAVRDKLLSANPMEGLEAAKHQKAEVEPFTSEEAERIIAGASKHYTQIANMVEFWFRTGLRTSELFGLKWSSTAGATVIIREALVAGVEEDSTKTNNTRVVMIDARAQAALARQKAHTFVGGTGHVFIDPYTGKPWANTQAFSRRCWMPLLKRLQIPHRRPYNIRHTRATEMLMAGVNPAFAARQLGHDVNVYLTVYAKWLTGANDAVEMAKLEGKQQGTGT